MNSSPSQTASVFGRAAVSLEPQRDRIIFIGDYLFPEGDAAAVRTMSLARACRDLGYRVLVLGKGDRRVEDYEPKTGTHLVEGIEYDTMNPGRVTDWERLRHPFRRLRLFGDSLRSRDLAHTRAVIINASGSALHLPAVRAVCRRHAVPLIGEVSEWYDARQMRYGHLDPSLVVFRLAFRFVFPRMKNLIVISRLLEEHFRERVPNVVRIPPVVDVGEFECAEPARGERLRLLYAGMPGRKDLLREVFLGIASLAPEERERIEFRLFGPTHSEVRALLGGKGRALDALGETVRVLGRVSRRKVLDELKAADFTILLRPDLRYANAGFPSKVPESLAAGVPILLNFTSDLREYLGDETASLAVPSCGHAAIAATLRKALLLTPAELAARRRSARAKAEQYFDYRLYGPVMAQFFEALV